MAAEIPWYEDACDIGGHIVLELHERLENAVATMLNSVVTANSRCLKVVFNYYGILVALMAFQRTALHEAMCACSESSNADACINQPSQTAFDEALKSATAVLSIIRLDKDVRTITEALLFQMKNTKEVLAEFSTAESDRLRNLVKDCSARDKLVLMERYLKSFLANDAPQELLGAILYHIPSAQRKAWLRRHLGRKERARATIITLRKFSTQFVEPLKQVQDATERKHQLVGHKWSVDVKASMFCEGN
mmetsp:Transcript_7449/g.22639  ORF Transcript_7449/g.22639 Transcript_7449/m.22639 type:complete len:249 (+) Transcript_7449:211-957(+)